LKPAVLILGATGVVGQGIVAAAVEAGLPVIAVARDPTELGRLVAAHPEASITPIAGSVATERDSAALAAAVRGIERPLAGAIVAVSGPRGRGRVLDQSVETMRGALDADLLPHLAAARHLLPLLADGHRGGSYVLIGGPGGALPWAGYGHRSVAAAAVRMLACVLHDEARGLGVRVQLLAVDAPVCQPGEAHACPQWPTATAIGRRAIALVERSDARDAASAIVAFSSRTPTATPADSDATERAQQDARRLLRSLSSPPNANEVSPHDSP
jgi:NAD(P)-dependent dehydrogenase (short-subunit alcohol dehydrogenase family)